MSHLPTSDRSAFAPPRTGSLRPFTLADLQPGETGCVLAVPPALGPMLADLGLRVGAHVRCESVARVTVMRTADGRVPLGRAILAKVRAGPPAALADAGTPP